MIGDIENDVAIARLRASLGCDEVVVTLFDHGRDLAAVARWGDVEHAERIRIANIANKAPPLRSDFDALAEKLRAWKERHDRRS